MERELLNSQLRKPNQALVMIPQMGKLTLISRKMFNVLLHVTQSQIEQFKAKGTLPDAGHMFAAPLPLIARYAASGDSDPRTLAKQYLSEMRDTRVAWEAPDAGGEVVWRNLGLLAEAGLEVRSGVTWVLWSLPPTLFKAIEELDRYTQLDLEEMAELRSYTSISLYEICARYRNNPTGVTSRNTPDWWVDALTNTPAAIDPVTGQKKRREWRKLKSESIAKAIAEINEKTDIEIDLIEHKQGRAVSEIQFSVRKKVGPSRSQHKQLSPDLAELAAKVGLSVQMVANESQAGRSDAAIRTAMLAMEHRLQREDLVEISSKPAYFRSVVEDVEPQLKTAVEPGRPARLKEEPISINAEREKAKADIKAMTAAEQLRLATLAMERLTEKNVATAVVRRNFQEKKWFTGVLFSAMQDIMIEMS